MLIITSILAGFAMTQAAPANEPVLHCVKTLDVYAKPSEQIDYRGIRYGTCCEGCAAAFTSEPEVWIKKAADKGVLIGYSLFDVVSGARVIALPKSPFTDYKAVRYYFKTEEDKTKFDSNPSTFSKAPDKELTYCYLLNQPMGKETDSAGYVDVAGARYYVCCGNCFSALTRNPQDYASKHADKVTDATAHVLPKAQ